jgi:hypothetical protein
VVGVPFGPLVPVEPHLGRRREVGAELDEPWAEVRVEHVEVVDPDPSFGFGLLEADASSATRALGGVEHPLELLGDDDGHHPEAAVAFRGVE